MTNDNCYGIFPNFNLHITIARSEIRKALESGSIFLFKSIIRKYLPVIAYSECQCEKERVYDYRNWLMEEGNTAIDFFKQQDFQDLSRFIEKNIRDLKAAGLL